MVKVACIALEGHDLMFYSNDHAPPHFHVRARDGSWEIRVMIETTTTARLDCSVKFARARHGVPPVAVGKALRRLVVAHRELLLAEWMTRAPR
jgi:hypothetical protein